MQIVVLMGILLMGVLILSSMSKIIRNLQPRPPSFAYTQNEFPPLDPEICPGDKLIIPITTEVLGNNEVILAFVTHSITNQNGALVRRPTAGDALSFPAQVRGAGTEPVTFNFDTSVDTTLLPPGEYRYLHYAQNLGSDGQWFTSDFSIIEC